MNSFSYMRLLHAAPGISAVDVYVNGETLITDLTYKELTDYFTLMPGNFNFKVFRAGETVNPLIDENVTIPMNSTFTAAVAGQEPNIRLIPIQELYMPDFPESNRIYLRFAHLSPDAPPVDVTLPNGQKVFADVPFGSYTNYLAIRTGTYTFQIRPAGQEQVVLVLEDIELEPGVIYTIYAVGFLNDEPQLEVIISEDGFY